MKCPGTLAAGRISGTGNLGKPTMYSSAEVKKGSSSGNWCRLPVLVVTKFVLATSAL